jgi:hypothetical protein
MIKEIETIIKGISDLINVWESRLNELPEEVITEKRNSQSRNIKQITGHMIDSASNNTHRIVHLQYQESPFQYPNYATNGNNDRWIAIQNYQKEDWNNLVQLWKYANLHIAHVIGNISPEKLENEWIASPDRNISLRDMVTGYLDHLQLHLDEINELINRE